MTIQDALQIVLSLAVKHMADENEHPEEFDRQDKATDMVSGLIDALGDQ